MKLYKDDLLFIVFICLGFMIVLMFTFFLADDDLISKAVSLFFIYVLCFRIPFLINLEESKVVVRSLLWRYSYSVNRECKVSDWGLQYIITIGKGSLFIVPKGIFLLKWVNEGFIKSLSSEMRKRAENKVKII